MVELVDSSRRLRRIRSTRAFPVNGSCQVMVAERLLISLNFSSFGLSGGSVESKVDKKRLVRENFKNVPTPVKEQHLRFHSCHNLVWRNKFSG